MESQLVVTEQVPPELLLVSEEAGNNSEPPGSLSTSIPLSQPLSQSRDADSSSVISGNSQELSKLSSIPQVAPIDTLDLTVNADVHQDGEEAILKDCSSVQSNVRPTEPVGSETITGEGFPVNQRGQVTGTDTSTELQPSQLATGEKESDIQQVITCNICTHTFDYSTHGL